jgi:hypothetical protein
MLVASPGSASSLQEAVERARGLARDLDFKDAERVLAEGLAVHPRDEDLDSSLRALESLAQYRSIQNDHDGAAEASPCRSV